jgi:hypothetical protein
MFLHSPPNPIISFREAGHLGVEGIFDEENEQQVNKLLVSVDPVTSDRVITGDVDLQWTLYTSENNEDWVFQGIVDPIFISDSLDPRFEIDIPSLAVPLSHDFLKAVAINQATMTSFSLTFAPSRCFGVRNNRGHHLPDRYHPGLQNFLDPGSHLHGEPAHRG